MTSHRTRLSDMTPAGELYVNRHPPGNPHAARSTYSTFYADVMSWLAEGDQTIQTMSWSHKDHIWSAPLGVVNPHAKRDQAVWWRQYIPAITALHIRVWLVHFFLSWGLCMSACNDSLTLSWPYPHVHVENCGTDFGGVWCCNLDLNFVDGEL